MLKTKILIGDKEIFIKIEEQDLQLLLNCDHNITIAENSTIIKEQKVYQTARSCNAEIYVGSKFIETNEIFLHKEYNFMNNDLLNNNQEAINEAMIDDTDYEKINESHGIDLEQALTTGEFSVEEVEKYINILNNKTILANGINLLESLLEKRENINNNGKFETPNNLASDLDNFTQPLSLTPEIPAEEVKQTKPKSTTKAKGK